MDFSSDEHFGTLGGSLMKDLLADLQVDDGDFSLDQLEKELATLDQEPEHLQPSHLPAMDAASLVVSHAQGVSAPPGVMNPPGLGTDAWSLSLQNFTALSLQDDFLAADSARKQQHQPGAPPQPTQLSILEGAEDYDVKEKPALTPPPGLGRMPVVDNQKPPSPQSFPKTPSNSVVVTPGDANVLRSVVGAADNAKQEQVAEVPTQPPVVSVPSDVPPAPKADAHGTSAPSARAPVPSMAAPQPGVIPQATPPGMQPPPQGVMPQLPGMPPAQPVQPGMPPHAGHPAMMMPPQMPPQMMQQIPPQMVPQIAPPTGSQPIVMAAPTMGGPAWQTPKPPTAQPPVRAFCNPHPAAPTIPATELETKFMPARDIAYVVHSLLKAVLAEGMSENDYYIQYLRRLGGPAKPSNPKKALDMNEEMASRATKTKEWSSEKGVLGRVAKSNAARPRALIATPHAASEPDTEQKQRATLWKARIYCDQAYQSYQAVVDIWRAAPPGGVPPQVQIHLTKLMKCMGITHVDKEYQVDKESLSMLVKLNKGKTLIARTLEQALLPPTAVLALLPVLLDVLLDSLARKNDGPITENLTCERLFRSVTGVVQKLNTSSDTLLQCLASVQGHGKVSLASQGRMECVHTILQKGSVVASQDPSDEKRSAWTKAEGEFMKLLQAY